MRTERVEPPSWTWLALMGAIVAFFGTHAGRHWDFTVDDAGISFAYARHLAEGYGLVLSPGSERVEAATNFLWCLVLVPAHWMGDQHELLAKLLGLFFASGALVLVGLFPSVAYQRRPRYFDLVAPMCASVFPTYALWCVSGLENGMFSFLAAASILALAHEENRPSRFPWSSVWLVLLFATRPDGILYVCTVIGAKTLRQLSQRRPRQDLVFVLMLGLGIGGLELFRLAYFAWPWPNSYYTKRRTFDFGRDLFTERNQGVSYVGRFLLEYKLKEALYVVPMILLGLRAVSTRLALLGFGMVMFFFPIYSHGDWMEEYRFLSFGVPLLMLLIAESVRAGFRIVQVITPRSARGILALAATPVLGYFVIAATTRHFPDRARRATHHDTLELSWVTQRANYFTTAARMLDIGRDGSVLDPDVGGHSYAGTLRVVDMFGLGEIPIAQTHPNNPPGTREAIFWERRPTFIHLHGAWFNAMELPRLEEVDFGYLRLPSSFPNGTHDPDTNYVRREAIAAPWYLTEQLEPPAGAPLDSSAIDGYTLSHRSLDPGRRMMIEFTIANPTTGSLGTIALVPAGRGRTLDAPVEFAGTILDAGNFIRGERPRGRVWFIPAPGRYEIVWRRGFDRIASFGPLIVRSGAGEIESRGLRSQMAGFLREGNMTAARRLARRLGLRVTSDPRDATALDALALFGRALADRALQLASDAQAFRTSALLARQAAAWAADDPRTLGRVQAVAERLADAAREADSRGEEANGFVLAREAVLTDPRRSWSRRRAEELRPRRIQTYDGASDQMAYRFAAAVRAGDASIDRAVVFMGANERWIEAVQLAQRVGRTPTDPRARVVLARGHLAQGDVTEALAMVSGVPCVSAHDPEVTRALRVLLGRPYRPGDRACETPLPSPEPPFDAGTGSFELGRWGSWAVTGNAFGPRPTHDHTTHQWFANGWRGWFFANSYRYDADVRTGLLRSRRFIVSGEGISFLVGGGSDASVVGVRLVVDGEAVLRAAGAQTEGLHRVFWDVRRWVGRTAVLEVYDESTVGWGHVLADDFRLEPILPPSALSSPAL